MHSCILCGARTSAINTPEMGGVTSDGRPWPEHGTLVWCPACGHVQKETGKSWQENVDAIYRTYTTYAIAGSKDQQLFLDGNNTAIPRFHALLTKLSESITIGKHGSLLDYGCGDGNFLQTFSLFFPEWELHGHEYGVEHQEKVLAIPGVHSFSYGDVSCVEGIFDGISVQHVLEHLSDPIATLTHLGRHMGKDGWLFTQVPTFWNDPFELMIVDHCSHFTEASLHNLLVEAHWDNFQSTGGWIPKNIGFVSRCEQKKQTKAPCDKDAAREHLSLCLRWLAQLAPNIVNTCGFAPLGILGTSNAATWTASMLKERVSFFVDEDPAHWGCFHLGLPVLSPNQTSAGDNIFAAFAPPLAQKIATRLNQSWSGHFFAIPWSSCNT